MKKASVKFSTAGAAAAFAALARLPDTAIDISEPPDLRDRSRSRTSPLYRPVKQQLTLRLDADVIAWFREHATETEGYQTQMNRVLREYVDHQLHKTG